MSVFNVIPSAARDLPYNDPKPVEKVPRCVGMTNVRSG